jgi:hypothetical protein
MLQNNGSLKLNQQYNVTKKFGGPRLPAHRTMIDVSSIKLAGFSRPHKRLLVSLFLQRSCKNKLASSKKDIQGAPYGQLVR